MISTYISHEKEFAAIAIELQKLQESMANLTKQVNNLKETTEDNQIRSDVALSQILDRELMTQDNFDKLMEMLVTIAKQKGFRV